jgi:hypothetical protein
MMPLARKCCNVTSEISKSFSLAHATKNMDLGTVRNKPCTIDSVFHFGGDTFRLNVKHYCLWDSAIKVPKKYVYMYKLDSFVTHNFATDIKLDKNNSTILQKTIYKRDFNKFLRPQLRDYGALLCPEMSLSNDTIQSGYSISIPLTDVGIGLTMGIDHNGHIFEKGE